MRRAGRGPRRAGRTRGARRPGRTGRARRTRGSRRAGRRGRMRDRGHVQQNGCRIGGTGGHPEPGQQPATAERGVVVPVGHLRSFRSTSAATMATMTLKRRRAADHSFGLAELRSADCRARDSGAPRPSANGLRQPPRPAFHTGRSRNARGPALRHRSPFHAPPAGSSVLMPWAGQGTNDARAFDFIPGFATGPGRQRGLPGDGRRIGHRRRADAPLQRGRDGTVRPRASGVGHAPDPTAEQPSAQGRSRPLTLPGSQRICPP